MLLWQALRRVEGMHFTRQIVIEGFIVDFCCRLSRVVIEVDGPIHRYQRVYDARRERVIRDAGFRIIRFTNDQVNAAPEAVALKIARFVIDNTK